MINLVVTIYPRIDITNKDATAVNVILFMQFFLSLSILTIYVFSNTSYFEIINSFAFFYEAMEGGVCKDSISSIDLIFNSESSLFKFASLFSGSISRTLSKYSLADL